MPRFLLALPLIGCAPLDEGADVPLPYDWDEASPAEARVAIAPGLQLTQDPLVPGTAVSMTVSGAAPGERIHFLYSRTGTGAGPCIAPLGGLCLDLLPPVRSFGSDLADASGTAEVVVPLPAGAPPGYLFTQAVVAIGPGSVATNHITAPILSGALDSDGDGYCGGATCADPATLPGDCHDGDPGVNPGVTTPSDLPYWTGSALSFDWDCDGVETLESTATYACTSAGGPLTCPSTDGWDGPVPACGQDEYWGEGCIQIPLLPICAPFASTLETQRCI